MALHRHTLRLLKTCTTQILATHRTDFRGMKRWVAPTLREIQRRKDLLGEQPPKPRSSYLEWNFDAEIYAFGKRLGEEFDQDVLRKALTHICYINVQEMKMNEDANLIPISTEANTELISRGDEIIAKSIRKAFENKYPDIICKAIHDYLTSNAMLGHVGSYIGLKDLILTSEFPVETSTIAKTFKAVVAALEDSVDLERSELFVKEILLSQLNGKEVFDIWEPEEPYNYLKDALSNKTIEPRLCNQSASNTLLANYQVGIYSEKKLLGLGWGETIDIAKDTAALNAIQKIYNLKQVV